ncbi:unnamed protein product [Linum trigynum]
MSFVENNIGLDKDIRCPCNQCLNALRQSQDVVFAHLLINGIDTDYTKWAHHGETFNSPMDDIDVNDNLSDCILDNEEEDDLFDLLAEHQSFINNDENNGDDITTKGYEEFIALLGKAHEELYPGCDKYSRLSFVVKLLHLKVYNKWSNKSFDMLLKLLKDALPTGNLIPSSYYEAKNMLRSLGLGYIPIHACPYDCALYWKENEKLEACPICKTSRWKVNDGKGKKIPWKILRYFPLKPRLRRLFMSSKTAVHMRWHKEKRNDDGNLLSHPADSKEWKDFDAEYPWFAADSRSVRLGLASDGFNPFGNMSNSYSMWPVVLTPYNLPPWMCMKEPYLLLTLLIPGPLAPGKDIDVYLKPLVDELQELWLEGTQAYDVHSKCSFKLHAALIWTINDFPAYGNLSGWSTKGYLACPICNKDSSSHKLKSKIGYLGHRRFLPIQHRWRKDRKKFNGKQEMRPPPVFLSGYDILEQLAYVTARPPGKHPEILDKRKRPCEDLNWVKRSIFFTLPYWRSLKLRNNLDVMHIEKNICDNVVGTLLSIPGKTKDTVKAREDLEVMRIRKELQLVKRSDGRYDMPPPLYTMTKQERKDFCQFLKEVKFPDAYASNISRCANVVEGKVTGLKSHDCHILLQRLLPVGVRGGMDAHVANVLAELGDFFHRLCCKTLSVEALDKLQEDIIMILCKLEMIYPPAFFDVMVHLAIHLPYEAKLGGPVQYRWMYPIERFLSTLKGFVRNRAYPEGSIAEAYLVDECLTFCSMYLDGIETQFNAPERNYDIEEDGNLSIFSTKVRPIGGSQYVPLSDEELEMAHWYVLSNCEDVQPYMEEHLNSIEAHDLVRKHDVYKKQFPKWFQKQMENTLCSNKDERTLALDSLSRGPLPCVNKYTGCIINGVRYHTKDREGRLKSQNSGVVVEGNHCDEVIDFYGVLLEIIKLYYLRDKHVYLFKCGWFNVDRQKSRIVNDGAITSIRVDRFWYMGDPFVLANQAKQVYYTNDPKLGLNWRVVQLFNHRHIFSGDIENLDDPEISNDMSNNEDAYQDEELINVLPEVGSIEIDGEVSLRRDDVAAEVVDVVIRRKRTASEREMEIEDAHEEVDHESGSESDVPSIATAPVDKEDVSLDSCSEEEDDELGYEN